MLQSSLLKHQRLYLHTIGIFSFSLKTLASPQGVELL
jgi:hypothetical protein